MRNTVFILLATIFVIICIVCISLINFRAEKNQIKKDNMEYEIYLNKEIFGTELATLISRAIDSNEKNNVEKDEKGYYIDNGKDSIKIDLDMTTIEKTYPMEEIYNSKMTLFVQNFNIISFKCTSIEYHKQTGRISKLVFKEIE